MAEPATDLKLEAATVFPESEAGAITGRSPGYLAWRRLRRNYIALASLVIFILIVVACLLAPVYASHVAHSGPNTNHITDRVKVGRQAEVRHLADSAARTPDPATGELKVQAGARSSARPGVAAAAAEVRAGRRTATAATWPVRLLYGGQQLC